MNHSTARQLLTKAKESSYSSSLSIEECLDEDLSLEDKDYLLNKYPLPEVGSFTHLGKHEYALIEFLNNSKEPAFAETALTLNILVEPLK